MDLVIIIDFRKVFVFFLGDVASLLPHSENFVEGGGLDLINTYLRPYRYSKERSSVRFISMRAEAMPNILYVGQLLSEYGNIPTSTIVR